MVCGLQYYRHREKNAQKEEEKQGQVKVVTHLQGWSNSFNRCVYLFLVCVCMCLVWREGASRLGM